MLLLVGFLLTSVMR